MTIAVRGCRSHDGRSRPCPPRPAASRPAPCRGLRRSLRRSFAKITVNQSQIATSPVKTFSAFVDDTKSRKKMSVQSTLPISTTNITGLCAIARGSSFRKLSLIAGPTTSRSKTRARVALTALRATGPGGDVLRQPGAGHVDRHGGVHEWIPSCSTIGPRARTGKYVSPTTIRTTPTSRPPNNGVPVGNVPAVAGVCCLRASAPR